MPEPIPNSPEDLNLQFINQLVGEMYPTVKVVNFEILSIKKLGEANVSTSARASLKLEYSGDGAEGLPSDVIAKMSMGDEASEDIWCARLYPYYQNELRFYKKIRPTLELNTPRSLGGRYDDVGKRYVLLLEDLTAKSVHFSSMTDDITAKDVASVIDTLARLHARYWQSPRLNDDLAWIPTHVSGEMEEHRRKFVYQGVRQEVANNPYKREILQTLKTNEDELFKCVHALKNHSLSMPQMILHGDCHIGNTYLAGTEGGVYDWQCFSRGFGIHDLTYLINTALSVERRRKHERELLRYYRDQLGSYGVSHPPDLETLWLSHRRQSLVSFCPGWFCTPVVNYGWSVLVVGLQRLSVAVQDLESQKAIAALM